MLAFTAAGAIEKKDLQELRVIVTSSGEASEFNAALKAGLPMMVKFGADWCPPCRMMKPVLQQLKSELKGKVSVVDLDVDKHRELAERYGISLIPTMIFIDRNGRAVGKNVGFMSKDEVKARMRDFGFIK